MSEQTNIEWCDSTFNPWIGCQDISPACKNCYAAAWAKRYGRDFAERTHTSSANWKQPIKWQAQAAEFMAEHGRRRRVFCASLADVFDNQVPPEWRRELFDLIELTPDLDWLLLTKRIGNVQEMVRKAKSGDWLAGQRNVWLGATVVNQAEADRDIPKLLAMPARVRFLSMEPLLGPVDLRLERPARDYDRQDMDGWCSTITTAAGAGIKWVIVGGESGAGARPMHPDWVRSLRDQCDAAGVPFHFKQWGEWGPFVNEAHYTHGGAEKHAHAWVDAETAEHGKCWLVDDDGTWSNWTGEPRQLPDGEDDGNGGTLHAAVAVMGNHGKKVAGRLLDGIEHNGFPGAR